MSEDGDPPILRLLPLAFKLADDDLPILQLAPALSLKLASFSKELGSP